MTEKTLDTIDVSSMTNRVMMAMDREFRKVGVHTFPGPQHVEVRPTVEALVASILADYTASVVIEETREDRG